MKRKTEKDDNRKEMSTEFQRTGSRWMFLSREKGEGVYKHRWLCLCIWVSQEAAAHLLQRNSKRLRNWTHQVPLEMHLRSRTENRTGSNSPSSDLKPSNNLPKSTQPGNYLPSPPTSHLDVGQVASSREGWPTETRQGWRRGEGNRVRPLDALPQLAARRLGIHLPGDERSLPGNQLDWPSDTKTR